MNSRVSEPVLSAETHCGLQIESVLRIRPLLRKEREDVVMLEPLENTRNGPETVILNPLHPSLMSPVAGSSLRNRADSDSTSINVPIEYHFNHVLPETTNQDKLYYTLGHPVASDTMKSLKNAASSRSYGPKKTKTHLLVCMGVVNSGKTYTCFGGTPIPKRRAAQDGLFPRLMDSLFSQSKHNTDGTSNGFALQLSMIQVTQPTTSNSSACQVHDLFAFAKTKMATDTPSKRNATVRNMAAKFERAISSPGGRKTPKGIAEEANTELDPENPKPTIESVRDATQAREMLQKGLSASEKLSKGNQNFHLLATMQPVVDGTKYGDKIVVLDMAGLEKEKRSGGNSNRKSDNVSSLNQTATTAVLRCLRIMTHNNSVSSGKGNVVDFTGSEDDVSEISFVSQAKDPMKRHLKPVPFRQHKVTMLLNPLFTKSSLVKVSILLAAYPGHNDLQQKRMLMQDVELLHGSSLVPPLSAVVETGLNSGKSPAQSEDKDADDDSSSTIVENKQAGGIDNTRTKGTKSDEENPMRLQAFRSKQPTAAKMSRHYSGVTSKAVRVEKAENRHVAKPRIQRQVRPSAPTFPQISTPREEITDFPGVDIPTSIDRNKTPFNTRQSIERSNVQRSIGQMDPKVDELTKAGGELNDVQGGALSSDKKNNSRDVHSAGVGRSPLERSSLENFATGPWVARGMKDEVAAPVGEHKVTTLCPAIDQNAFQTHHRPFAVVKSNDTSSFQSQEDNDEKIKTLEKKLQQSIQEKNALERVCAQLEKENAELRNEAREAGRKVLQRQWTDKDEEEFMASRRMRREAQKLIKAPIQEHLEKVNYVYEIKNQWCMTNKRHFSLQFPNQFQRAPALDRRDKANKEAGSEQGENDDQQVIHHTRSEDLEYVRGKRSSFGVAKPRKSLVTLPQKTVQEPPKGLSALKLLTAGRASKY